MPPDDRKESWAVRASCTQIALELGHRASAPAGLHAHPHRSTEQETALPVLAANCQPAIEHRGSRAAIGLPAAASIASRPDIPERFESLAFVRSSDDNTMHLPDHNHREALMRLSGWVFTRVFGGGESTFAVWAQTLQIHK